LVVFRDGAFGRESLEVLTEITIKRYWNQQAGIRSEYGAGEGVLSDSTAVVSKVLDPACSLLLTTQGKEGHGKLRNMIKRLCGEELEASYIRATSSYRPHFGLLCMID
jgi:hypothetical protein